MKHILSLLLTCMLIIECLLFLLWTLAYFDLSPIPQSPFGLQLIAILILILSTVILLFYIGPVKIYAQIYLQAPAE